MTRSPSRLWAAGLGYTLLFAWFGRRWLPEFQSAVPVGFGNRLDERLVVYILAWGAHVLATGPANIFAMPINYPAPRQLSGSEHLLSSQLLFAPVYWWTDNPVLAANVATFASYPLTALAMYWCALVLGAARWSAFASGLALALGSALLPAHFHVLQYLALYFPLIAGALTRLRERPTPWRAVQLAVVATLAFFSSYYTFALSLFVAGVWGLAELLRRAPARGRFVLLAGAALGSAVLTLFVFSLPYLGRPESITALGPQSSPKRARAILFLATYYVRHVGKLLYWLPVVGTLAVASRTPGARIAARRGLTLALLGYVMMLGPVQYVRGTEIPLPYALVLASPLRFVRYPFRFVGLVNFGRALLILGGLEGARRFVPKWLATTMAIAVAAALIYARGPGLVSPKLDRIESLDAPGYALVARAAATRPAPVLELPVTVITEAAKLSEGDALVGQTRHWQPLLTGHTGFQPPHRRLVGAAIQALPDRAAAQDLVDMTHMGWVLLRPAPEWPDRMARQRSAILQAPWLRRRAVSNGWVLLQVELKPRNDAWFRAIEAGWHPGVSILGTSTDPIAPADAAAVLRGRLPLTVPRDGTWGLRIEVENTGRAPWAVTIPAFVNERLPRFEGNVYLESAWRPLDRAAPPLVGEHEFRRDVAPGETLAQPLFVATPEEAGVYVLEIRVRQRDGEGFAPPRTLPLAGRVVVR